MAEVGAYSAKLTNLGAAAIVRAIFSGEKVELTTAEFGDGGGESYEPTADQTSLVNTTYTTGVTNFQINDTYDNMIDIYAEIPTEEGGFWVREVGIRDSNGDLFCVGCIPPAEKVVGSSLVTNELAVVLHIVVADASVVSFTLSDSIRYLTQSDMDAHETDEDAHQNLWIPGSFYATCSTSSDTADKAARCSQILNQQPGTIVRCAFTEASTDGDQTMDVAGLGAADLVGLDGEAVTWQAGDELIMQYDGTRWVVLLNLSEEQRAAMRPLYHGVSNTVAAAETKTVSIDDFDLVDGVRVAVQFKNSNTHTASRLNISNTGAYYIYHNGTNVPAGLFSAGAWVLVQYVEADGVYNVLGEYSQATDEILGRVRVLDEADESKTAADGCAVSPAALAACISSSEKGEAGGVAQLGADGKVVSTQLRGGWILSSTAPDDTTLLWIGLSGVMKYYDGSSWVNVLPVCG